MIDWTAVVTSVLLAIVVPLVAAGARALWAWGSSKFVEIKKEQPEVSEFLQRSAYFAVQAAEQSGLAKLITDKKAYALETAERWLIAHGVVGVDLHLIEAAIEKAVLENFPHEENKEIGFKQP